MATRALGVSVKWGESHGSARQASSNLGNAAFSQSLAVGIPGKHQKWQEKRWRFSAVGQVSVVRRATQAEAEPERIVRCVA